MSTTADTLVSDQAEADLANRRANVLDTYTRLDFEKAWVLHRALTLNTSVSADPADAWKGSSDKPATWTEEQRAALQKKYYNHLMTL